MSYIKTDIIITQEGDHDPIHPLDPWLLASEAHRLGHRTSHWEGKPNGYYTQLGTEPGNAFLLISKKDLDNLDKAADFSLVFHYGSASVNLSGLRFAYAHALYTDSHDPGNQTPYLLCLQDKRAWFRMSVLNNHAYNCLCPSPPEDADASADFSSQTSLYYADSLTGGNLWSWQDMLDDLWDELPGQGPGDCPTLPFAPDDYPRNFRFVGVPTMDAIQCILDKLHCGLAYSVTSAIFSFVDLSEDQDLTSITNVELLSSYAPVQGPSTNHPETIRVFFHRREEHHGTEREIKQASGNFIDAGPYTKDITTSLADAVAGTVLPLWDDMPAVYAFDGTHLNQAACDARATEVAGDYKDRLNNVTGWARYLLRGLQSTVLLGSKIGRMSWSDKGHPEIGMATELVGPSVPADALFQPFPTAPSGPNQLQLGSPPFSSREAITPGRESLAPTDIMRQGFPVYPRVFQYVQAIPNSGKRYSSANASGVFEGKVMRFDPEQGGDQREGTWTQGPDCWILDCRQTVESISECVYQGKVGVFTNNERVDQAGSGAWGYLFQDTGTQLDIHTGYGSAAFETGAGATRRITGAGSGATVDMDAAGAPPATVTVPTSTIAEDKVNILPGYTIFHARLNGSLDVSSDIRPLFVIDERTHLRQFECTEDFVQNANESWPISFAAQFNDEPGTPAVEVYRPGELDTSTASAYYVGVGRVGGGGQHGSVGYARWQEVRRRWEYVDANFKLLALAVYEDVADLAPGGRGQFGIYWKDLGSDPVTTSDSANNVEAYNWYYEKIETNQKVILCYDRQENLWFVVDLIYPCAVQSDNVRLSGTGDRFPIGKIWLNDEELGYVTQYQLDMYFTSAATGEVGIQVLGPSQVNPWFFE